MLDVYLRHAEVHPYGIADVVQLWDRSRWWVVAEAVVGVMDLPGSPVPVLYAVSATAAEATLRLVQRLEPQLPDHIVATAPSGFAAALAGGYDARWARPYVKMHLADPGALPPSASDVVALGRDDLPALERLFATDPIAGDFFHPALLDTGLYFGRWDGDELVAAGGVHVIEPRHKVAAVGNVTTHPAHRRRGLATAVMATLCHALLERVATVGLNVRRDNTAAQALYRSLGFATILPYEEAEIVRR